MKKQGYFFTGIATGIGAVLVVLIVFVGLNSVTDVFGRLINPSEPVVVEQEAQFTNNNYDEFEKKVDDVIERLDTYYYKGVEMNDMYDEAVRGMVDSLGDPYTAYFTADEYASFMEKMGGSYEGIGVVVGYGETEDEVLVVAPFKDSPGEKAGMEPGDRIIAVDGTDVIGLDIDQIVQLIKGEQGSQVIITVTREEETIDIPIIRDVIEIPTVDYRMLEGNIGYIGMSGFDQVTKDQFVEALDDLDGQGQDGLIIDLRNNPGGYLHIVYGIVDELLGKGELVVYTEDKNGKREELVTENKDSFNKPLVILVNGNSASASEILAGAVKDHEIGTIVGETTFGKGVVQRTFELEDGSAVKITVSRYYTPDGNYIQGVGIVPDVIVEYDPDYDGDNQLDKAIEVIQSEIQTDQGQAK